MQNVNEDFQQVAQQAPPQHLAAGLASAFRSDQTPPFENMISNLFGQSNGEQRAGILNRLLGAAGPMAASGLAGGGLMSGLSSLLGSRGQVSPEQANQVSPEAVQELAKHAQQQNPSIIDQASQFYAQHPTLVQALGAGSLALIMSHISRAGQR
jgi:hypothetical protein